MMHNNWNSKRKLKMKTEKHKQKSEEEKKNYDLISYDIQIVVNYCLLLFSFIRFSHSTSFTSSCICYAIYSSSCICVVYTMHFPLSVIIFVHQTVTKIRVHTAFSIMRFHISMLFYWSEMWNVFQRSDAWRSDAIFVNDVQWRSRCTYTIRIYHTFGHVLFPFLIQNDNSNSFFHFLFIKSNFLFSQEINGNKTREKTSNRKQ